MNDCENCFYRHGACDRWMVAKKLCARFVAWDEVVAYLGGKVSLKPI